jgi:hypothetical protein
MSTTWLALIFVKVQVFSFRPKFELVKLGISAMYTKAADLSM